MSSEWIKMLGVIARQDVYANQIVLREASRIDRAILEASASPSRGSAYQLLIHLLGVEVNYLGQILGGEHVLSEQARRSIAELIVAADAHYARLLGYVDGLTERELARAVSFRFSTGAVLQFTAWQLLTQLFMHSAQHRGELSILLSELGHPLPIDDIIVRFADESGQAWPFR